LEEIPRTESKTVPDALGALIQTEYGTPGYSWQDCALCLHLYRRMQTDNGSEFSTHFTECIQIRHRHTRV